MSPMLLRKHAELRAAKARAEEALDDLTRLYADIAELRGEPTCRARQTVHLAHDEAELRNTGGTS